MGGMVEPVEGSGSWPIWIARVENFIRAPLKIVSSSTRSRYDGKGFETEESHSLLLRRRWDFFN
jgi:hypothetical protein